MDGNLKTMVLGLVVRHLLTSLAGMLVTLGVMNSGDQLQFITIGTGIVVGLATMAWSWWQKVGQAKLAELATQKGVRI